MSSANSKKIVPWIAAVVLVCPAFVAADEVAPRELDPIVVVASKTPRPMSGVAGQVSVVAAADIENHLFEGLDDLLRYEPGINTETSGTRFGVSGVNLRGIGGNRVAIEVDGVPVRDRFAVGSYSDGGRALVETDRIKRLEILHGPASTLYGSDALGGVMAITTWNPDDLLSRGEGDRYFSLRGAYKGADGSLAGSGAAAWAGDRTGLLFSATWRDGHELDNQAGPGAPVDEQNWDSKDYFLRLVHDTGRGHRLRLSVEDYARDANTRLRSILGFARFRSTTALEGFDRDETLRLGADYEFSGAFWDRGVARIFSSESTTEQLSLEERATARTPVRLQRFFSYESDLKGLELNLFRGFSTGGNEHQLAVGVEALSTDSREYRDGFQQTIADGSITKTVLGEVLPVRDFPVSTTDEYGIFIQDEILLGDGAWALIPALRYDRYELDPQSDAIFSEDNPAVTTVPVDEDEISPRFGVLHHLDNAWSLYGQYVRGFRAPPFEDANIGLDIPLFNIRAIPNPDLRSETSGGIEFGIRQFSPNRRFSLAFFNTDYDDFIETRARIGVDPVSGVLLFQSRNIEKARIYGVDIRLDQELGAWREWLENWTLNAAAYWSRGENRDNDQPLSSVSPPQAVIGLAWSATDERWNANLAATLTARQDEIDPSGGDRFRTPGYGTLDFTAGYRHADWLEFRFGVYNLGDKRYWRWLDVAGLDANDPMIGLLSRPGRNYSMSVRVEW